MRRNLARDPATGQIINKWTGKVVPWPFYEQGSMTKADGKNFILEEPGTQATAKRDRQG